MQCAEFWSALILVVGVLLSTPGNVMANEALNVTAATLQKLRALEPGLNFEPDEKTFYTGVFDPKDRLESDLAFRRLVDTLIANLPHKSSKSYVLAQFKSTLEGLPLSDTEDRERAAGYCEQIMDVLGIESSDGVLNNWLYGPIVSGMLKQRKQ
jgi:hypothetical protein